MNSSKVIIVESVGQVILMRNKRSRYFRLRVKPNGQVHVSMPMLASERGAIDFIRSKSEWIEQQQEKIKTGLTVFEEGNEFRTKFHELKIVRVAQTKVSGFVGNGIIQINIPRNGEQNHPSVQQFIRHALIEVMRQEAKVFLPVQVQTLANQHQFQFGKVFVKQMKSRWGSCSSNQNINLNLHLMRLPSRIIDYVLLHELCHTQEKNHQKSFWRLLEFVCPEARKLDGELKNYHVDIF